MISEQECEGMACRTANDLLPPISDEMDDGSADALSLDGQAAGRGDNDDAIARSYLFKQALARGARLMSGKDPGKARLFKRGYALMDRPSRLRASRSLSVFLILSFLLGSCAPVLMVSGTGVGDTGPTSSLGPSSPSTGTPGDFEVGVPSSNLTTSSANSVITVLTEEYRLTVNYQTSYVDYKLQPYFCTDFIRYRRVNPQYTEYGTYDSAFNALNGVSMTISSWGRSGDTVWFMESCPEFSLNQTFCLYRDYFELDATYRPGTKNVVTSYFFALYSASNSQYNMISEGHYYRYVPGYEEDRAAGAGMGGWYPSLWMYAPAFDLRAKNRNLGVEVGMNETVCYIGSPVWMKEPSTGGDGAFAVKYFTKDSRVPNMALTAPETFHLFVRPYRYTDGQDRGHDAGYAQWVAPKVAAAYGNPHQSVFPLLAMDLAGYTMAFRTWLEGSQIKVATQSNNPDQINWRYKACQLPNTEPGDPSSVPLSWQVYKAEGTPMTIPDGRVICNPISGPHDVANTFRWQLINNDPYMEWWTGSRGVFWDMMNMWSSDNVLRSDYQTREEFIMTGYLDLIRESFASGYWDFVVPNTYTALLQTSIASSVTVVEGYRPSSVYGINFAEHVHSTMNFTANIPEAYRPNILVYQNYDSTSNPADQQDVYDALFGSARYGYYLTLVSYDSFDSQMHNYYMAESMFKSMGCTRDSDARTVTVDTLDLSASGSLTTGAQMVVTKGRADATITETSEQARFIISNLHSTSNNYTLRVPGSGYYTAGPGAQALSPMTYTADGLATFEGAVLAERTANITRDSSIQVMQHTAGSATVSLAASAPNADLTVSSTGGSTTITLNGFSVGQTYDVLVDSALVGQSTAASDGSITITRSFDASDRVQTRLAASDTDPPGVSTVSPADGASAVSVASQVRVAFDESMDVSSTEAAFELSGPSPVPGSFSWESGNTVLVFTPASSLQYQTAYAVSVAATAEDAAGNFLSAPYSSSFLTEAAPVQVEPPSSPTALTAVGGTRSANLAWSAPSDDGGSGIIGYRVYRGPSNASLALVATLEDVLSYSDPSLANGTAYYYKVSALNGAGEGPTSDAALALTAVVVPGQPRSLSGSGDSNSTSLTWSAPESDGGSAITGYRVYRGPEPGHLSLLASVGGVLSYSDQGLPGNVTYYYQVSAVNSAGEGLASLETSVTTTLQIVAPSSPQGLVATAADSSVRLAWGAPASDGGASVAAYRVYRALGDSEAMLVATIPASLCYDDPGLANGATYRYQVSALNSAGESALSAEAHATPLGRPSSPNDLRAGIASAGAVDLSWSAPSDDGGAAVEGYLVLRGYSSDSLAPIASVTGTSYRDSGLLASTRYYYQVMAYSSSGNGTASSASIVTAGVPSAPLELRAEAGSSNASLSWMGPVSDGGLVITGYVVYRGLAEEPLHPLGTVPSPSFLDSGLAPGMTYVYAVSAVNAVGEGPPSSETSCVCRSKPSAPSGLTADRSEGGVSLAWSAPSQDGGSPVISYVVYRGSSSGQLSALATLEAVLAYEDLEPPVSSVVYYSVSAVNSVGEGERCEEGSLVLATKASAPTNVTVSNLDRAVRLSWEAPADDGGLEVTSYVIYRTSSNQTRMKVAEVNATSWVDTGLTNGETYNYNIAAVNACGESDQTCLAVGAPASYLRAQSNVGAALPDLGSLLAISALAAAAFAAAYLVIGRRRGRR